MVDTTHIFCAGLSLEASQSTAEGFHTQIHMGTRTLHQDTAGCERERGGGEMVCIRLIALPNTVWI